MTDGGLQSPVQLNSVEMREFVGYGC
jgi:hypothetical protein